MQYKFFTILILIIGLTNNISAQDIIQPYASYTGEYLYNMSGGIQSGGGYLGYAKLGLQIETSDLGWWKGGSFIVGGANTHGITASETFIGDFQVVSNIDAGNHTFLEYLSFQQRLGRFNIKVGLQDLNENFASSDAAGEYVNSSFGIHPVMSSNFCAPIFPITGLGLEFHFSIDEKWHVQMAAYDGYMTDFDENEYNLNWDLNSEDGYLFIAEAQHLLENGAYKLGTFYHSGESKCGIYAGLEQQVWENERHSLTAFIQSSFTVNEKHNNNYLHLGGGVNYSGIFSNNHCDAMGLAFTTVFLDDEHKSETAIEWFYKYNLTEKISIQPDLQYIFNPSGTEDNLNNAFVGLFRLNVEL